LTALDKTLGGKQKLNNSASSVKGLGFGEVV
jgi:hypothetical protein